MEEHEEVSRRRFIKGSVAAGAGLTAAALLAACSTSAQSPEELASVKKDVQEFSYAYQRALDVVPA